MLQPRLRSLRIESASVKMENKRNFGSAMRRPAVLAACCIFFSFNLISCQDLNLDSESIEVSRVKRDNIDENRDLTVLLVNDQKKLGDIQSRERIGRYHSVKPLIGLLTSTARTFIQDGVTTEFATQILGTTLDNGRIYAQLLTKSSLVLYNKPSAVDNDELVKPTRMPTAFDGQWNVKQDLGFIDPEKFVLKNTDYISPSSKMDIVYASNVEDSLKYWSPPSAPDNIYDNRIEEPTGRRVQPVNEIPRYKQNEAYNMLDGPAIDVERKLVVNPTLLDSVNTLHRQSKTPETVINVIPEIKDKFNDSNVVKVRPNSDLPTFTIKNEFSPIFYYIDNVESRNSVNQANLQTKMPKKMFGQKSEPKPKKTFTYAGFADFTTVVGDTVIVFSPNSEINRINNPNEVNVYPSARPADKMASKITHLASDIPLAKSTYKAHEVVKPSKILQMPKPVNKVLQPSKDDNRSDKALYNDRESLEKVLYEEDKMPDIVNVQYNNGFDFNIDVIQPSEAVVTTPENTRLTDDLGVIPINGLSSIATDPLKTLKPSATILESPKGSIINSNQESEQSVSSEEIENTAAEVESEEEATTDRNDTTTTESFTSNETDDEEEFEPTTESVPEQEVICTKGLETKSILTTAFKTLTYLTTYFIPLEGSELTSSIKSSVVVESDIGVSTKITCKSDTKIEPTAVVSVNVISSVHSSLEDTTDKSDENIINLTKEVVTEPTVDTTITSEDDKTVENFDSEEKEEKIETTTEAVKSITKESVEVSVGTEQTSTTSSTTEKSKPDEDEKKYLGIQLDQKENEVDVIYKTLYTTYTYLTTFFGDSATSVASHKSVVTNIVTSTVNLSEMDPELLGAFNEDEIAPTGVGIGRPTEAINSIIDLVKNKDVIESVEVNDAYSEQTPTPSLGDDVIASIKPDAVKTYFTTYTFFTTIYVGTDANVCSRSEVYTNYVGPDELIPTKVNPFENKNTRAQFDFRNCKQLNKVEEPNNSEVTSVESNMSREDGDIKLAASENKDSLPNPTPVEVDMLFSVESNPLESESAFVTDVKSSSSRGERKIIENNAVLDDQIVSESNIDEITPSPTLLLQTSYTTFTYYTTMYIGKESSKVKSRLETITNVVTETILPKKEAEVEENALPITYYTTFTYWTTLYKDKQTTITSREEIVSNVVTPTTQETPTVNPIDTTPIDIDTVLPPKNLEVELKPSLIDNPLESEDDKATFYTTYTYFTTFYVGNTSQIRSSLETVTNIVDNTKLIDDNRLGRKVQGGGIDKNLIQDDNKPKIVPSVVREEIQQTKLPDISGAPPTVLLGTYIDNLFEVKSGEEETKPKSPSVDKKILYSEVAVISGDSSIISNDSRIPQSYSNTTEIIKSSVSTPAGVIESSEGVVETTTENKSEFDEDDDESPKKKSRLSFTSKKPTFTPVIRPFASRNRPTFSPKRVPPIGSATTITRSDFTPTITATPSLKSARPAGFGTNRKASAFPGSQSSRKFNGRSSISNLASGNVPSPSRAGSFIRNSIQPTSRRTGFRSSSLKNNVADFFSRSAVPRIRPTPTVRLRGGRQSASVSPAPSDEQNESETTATQQQQDGLTETNEEVTEAPVKTTSNSFLRFRRPLSRQPGSAITTRSTTEAATRRTTPSRGRVSTTTRRTTTRTITNPILSLKRQRPNALFPRKNLFNKPEPEQQEIKNNEQEVEEESQEILDGEEGDNDYESSDRREQQVATPSTLPPTKSPNTVKIKPFAFRRRTKRQADYGNRKYSNFRRPNARVLTPKPDLEQETEEPVTQRIRAPPGRYTSRLNGRSSTSSPVTRANARTPFIVRGSTTTPVPAYRGRRPSSKSSSISSRPKAPRLQSYNSQSNSRSNARTSTSKTRTRGSTRANIRQRNSYENNSGERITPNHIVNDGKITVTHHIPSEVNIPIVMGKITEYKNVLTAKPSLEVILLNQLATSIGPLGIQQLLLPSEATELAENGATRVIKFVLHETPTTAVEFTPTTIRGRRTSYSHVIPSTVYNVERVASTLTPEINANVPLANLLLSQLLLGNGQQGVNPLLALQGQGYLQQQPVVATPVTEYKTRSTTYVTTITDNRETVLPITFKGVPILTTIKDPIVNVITATEFITDTIVSTPTALAQPANQFNSLLLPLLLQQQQQQQQQQQAAFALQTPNPLLGLAQPGLNSVQNNLLNNDIYSNSPKENVLTDYASNEEYIDENQESVEDVPITPAPAPARPKSKPKPHKPAPAKHTSIVTLYVSGRTPGEFSTVLSTLVTDETRTVNKREAIYYDNVKVLPSILPAFEDLTSSQYDSILENSVISDFEKALENQKLMKYETESLESIVGELSKHISYDATPAYIVKLARPTKLRESEQYTLDDVS